MIDLVSAEPAPKSYFALSLAQLARFGVKMRQMQAVYFNMKCSIC
jgi:hypothetical protein